MTPDDVLTLLSSLEKNPEQLNRRHLKKIYALLIAMGHYPICPWCRDYIYSIDDFSWDHISPKARGGEDCLENLQPMHKCCNNASKCDGVYQVDYRYDIKSELVDTIMSVRVTTIPRKKKNKSDNKKEKYHNNKVRTRGRSKHR